MAFSCNVCRNRNLLLTHLLAENLCLVGFNFCSHSIGWIDDISAHDKFVSGVVFLFQLVRWLVGGSLLVGWLVVRLLWLSSILLVVGVVLLV